MKLTDTAIRKVKPNGKAFGMSDGGGLYLWVTPAGGRLWRWGYKHDGKEKLMSFGKYPDVPLAQARERHKEARTMLASGVDPMAERKAAKVAKQATEENTFEAISKLWFQHWRDGKSPRHVDYVERLAQHQRIRFAKPFD